MGDEPRNAATLLADDEPVSAPNSLALAFLIEAVDVGGSAVVWQKAEAARALAWPIRRNSTASALLRSLEDDATDLTDAGSLVDAAQARA